MSKSSVALSRPAGNVLSRASLRADAPCIDLAQRFGQRYRVEYEESYFAQYGPRARVNDPWLKIIPCRAGHICPWGGSKLAAVTNKPGPTARKLAALPGTNLWQDGSDGATVLFDVGDFDQVVKIMQPRRRRTGTQRLRAHLAAVGAETRFQGGVGSRGEAEFSTQTPLADLGAVLVESGLIASGKQHLLIE